MKIKLNTWLLIFSMLLASSVGSQTPPPTVRAPTAEEVQESQWLTEGLRLIEAKMPQASLDALDKVTASYETRHNDSQTQYFSSRGLAETLAYLAKSSSATPAQKAEVLSPNWAYAYYFKGYALIELQRIPEARQALEQAIRLAPFNAFFLNELAHTYQLQKDWASALEKYQAAESAATNYSPPDSKNAELARAWRGMGFVAIEQGRLDDATRHYQQCVELNQSDQAALNELAYIQNLKAKAANVVTAPVVATPASSTLPTLAPVVTASAPEGTSSTTSSEVPASPSPKTP